MFCVRLENIVDPNQMTSLEAIWSRSTMISIDDMDLGAREPVHGGGQTTKAQTSLCIPAVWSASLLFAYCKVSYLDLLRAKFQLSS